MSPPEPFLSRAARWLTFGSAVSILLSIAISQILLALALAALLASGERLRLPRIKLPLALFMLGTVIALIFSADPAAGLPQIRKFYVFLELLVVFSTLRDLKVVRWLFLSWAGIGSLTAIRGFVQFAGKVQQAGKQVKAEDVARARQEGATDQEIHDTVLIAAVFCMANRYVDGLATWQPDDPEMYRTRAALTATHGYGRKP